MLTACSKPVDNSACTRNDDCVADHLCDPNGVCVQRDPVSVTGRDLPAALVGDGSYSETIQASSGLSPYTWSMKPLTTGGHLDWLEINAQTGQLQAKAGQTPTTAQQDLLIEVSVLDTSNAGAGQSASHQFGLEILECTGNSACWEDVGGVCQVGVLACDNGILAAECALDGPSLLAGHCGPGCGACPDAAYTCNQGRCACGALGLCDADETCCGDGCFNLKTSQNHCGDCDTDCDALTGVDGPFCDGSICDYTQCAEEFLECNDTTEDGCETASDMNNCSACGDKCDDPNVYLHTEANACDASACSYTCVDGYDSCDADPANGCETPLGTVTDCGVCGHACAGSNAGELCIDVAGNIQCGCEQDGDCTGDRMCCGGTCVPHAESHCADCDSACSILMGGLACVEVVAGTTWECQCAAKEDCFGDYTFSGAECFPANDQCTCGGFTNCSGTLIDMCCFTLQGKACVNMLTDVENCGTCGAICGAGESCIDGACSCATEGCPGVSGAIDCVNDECVCSYVGNVPCPPGQYCCESKGCCFDGCATPLDQCSNGCEAGGAVWCWSGCCENCESEADCPPLPN
jgi:hypothetical protein